MNNLPIKKLEDEFNRYLGVFYWNFKRMDNTVYNLEILSYLYHLRGKASSVQLKSLLNKPIIIFTISIVECVLYDFMTRIQQHSNEKIPNLDIGIINKIKYKVEKGVLKMKDLTKLNSIIPQLKAFNLLNWSIDDESIYRQLEILQKIRNKIHIQLTNDKLHKDERYIFNNANVKKSELVLETVLKAMMIYYPRPWNKDNLNADNFPYPWDN